MRVPALDLRAHAPAGPFLLVTYTFGRGEVPESTARFLERYAGRLRGVVASGSFHWGAHFARAGEQIAGRYGVPLVAELNRSGSEADAQAVAGWLLGNPCEHRFKTLTEPEKAAALAWYEESLTFLYENELRYSA